MFKDRRDLWGEPSRLLLQNVRNFNKRKLTLKAIERVSHAYQVVHENSNEGYKGDA